MNTRSRRVRNVKGLLWFVTGAATVVAVARFLGGLGLVTDLTDRTPWGLWIGFDVMGGVALAAGGFVLAATVYCFRREEFRPLLRPAILTAFLGYAAVAGGLLFDIGRPWNIWRPMFFWNPHSVLFEVAWCVMLYLSVLALEFLPVPLETSRFHRLAKALKKLTLPLVILGIMLSTLHQSSLGSLFLITSGRVHPLWETPIQPVLFFISAVGLGLAMVAFESKTTAWLYRRPPEDRLLGRLTVPLAVVLLLYGAIRLADLVISGRIAAFGAGWETALFILEMLLTVGIPAALVLAGPARRGGPALVAAAGAVVAGFVLNRIDVGGLSGLTLTETGYFPSFEEILTSLGVISAATLVFFFFVENFRVYEPATGGPGAESMPGRDWRTMGPPLATARTSSGLFVIGAALAFAFLPQGAARGARPERTPVRAARRVLAVTVDRASPPGKMLALAAAGTPGAREVLLLDGNRAGRMALFDHDDHIRRFEKEGACAVCHHLNRPVDRETSCYECHRDEYLTTELFDHARHVGYTGGNRACAECHPDPSRPKTREGAASCRECHPDLVVPGSRVKAPAPDSPYAAPGYMEALHGLCLTCHEEEDRKNGRKLPELSLCSTCHPETVDLTPSPGRGGR